jgi:hypothetical protein
MVWQVEEHLLAMRFHLHGLNTEVVQGRTSQVGLGIVQCFLEERSELGQLVASIKEAMKEEFYFFHNILSIRAQLANA